MGNKDWIFHHLQYIISSTSLCTRGTAENPCWMPVIFEPSGSTALKTDVIPSWKSLHRLWNTSWNPEMLPSPLPQKWKTSILFGNHRHSIVLTKEVKDHPSIVISFRPAWWYANALVPMKTFCTSWNTTYNTEGCWAARILYQTKNRTALLSQSSSSLSLLFSDVWRLLVRQEGMLHSGKHGLVSAFFETCCCHQILDEFIFFMNL